MDDCLNKQFLRREKSGNGKTLKNEGGTVIPADQGNYEGAGEFFCKQGPKTLEVLAIVVPKRAGTRMGARFSQLEDIIWKRSTN